MKKVLMMGMMLMGTIVLAQNKIDEVRMQRDIEVAENILGTLIKQQYDKRQLFPMEVFVAPTSQATVLLSGYLRKCLQYVFYAGGRRRVEIWRRHARRFV